MVYKATFNLPNYFGGNIPIGTTFPVVGNGNALVLSNGSTDRFITNGTVHDSKTACTIAVGDSSVSTQKVIGSSGVSVSMSNYYSPFGNGNAIGVSTNPNFSGMNTNLTNVMTPTFCIKY